MAVTVGVKWLKVLNYLMIFIDLCCYCLTWLCSNKASVNLRVFSSQWLIKVRDSSRFSLLCWTAGRLKCFAQEYLELAGQGCGGALGITVTGGCTTCSWAKSAPADSLLSAACTSRLGKDFFLSAVSGGTFPQKHINSWLSEICIYSESLGIASP